MNPGQRHVAQCLTMLLVLAAPVALLGCTDPFLNRGTWHATGVNDGNLRAMVAHPNDLEWGVDDRGANGRLAASAVTRFRQGQIKPLQDNGISKIGNTGAATAAPALGLGTGPN